MNAHQPNVLILPSKPPEPVNTILLAATGIMLNIGAAVTYYSSFKFPPNAYIEAVLVLMGSFSMFLIACILGGRAMINETKRNQYRYVITRYTNITGDKRYLPYILPVHTKLVTGMFVISVIISVVLPIITVFGGEL